jgi:hypothetical protein
VVPLRRSHPLGFRPNAESISVASCAARAASCREARSRNDWARGRLAEEVGQSGRGPQLTRREARVPKREIEGAAGRLRVAAEQQDAGFQEAGGDAGGVGRELLLAPVVGVAGIADLEGELGGDRLDRLQVGRFFEELLDDAGRFLEVPSSTSARANAALADGAG